MNAATIIVWLATTGLAVSPTVAAAQVFKPAGQWSLDYGDDYCRLSRSFSNGTDTLALALERIEPGANLRMILVSDAIKPYRTASQLGWHFTPSDAERKAPYTKSTVAAGQAYYNLGLLTIVPPAAKPGAAAAPYDRAAEQASAKAMDGIVIDNGLTAPVTIETGALQPPIAAMQDCADDLAKTWGLDPAKLRAEKAAALPDGPSAGWLPQGTIAFADLAKLADGSNQVRLLVDAEGKPTNCHVVSPALDPAVNARICTTLMANAKFVPAKDGAGQAMPGYYLASPAALLPPLPMRKR